MRMLGVWPTLTGVVLIVVAWHPATLEASEETVKKDAAQGPIDSSQVIPKGPQWLGAPLMPNGKTLKSESSELVTEYDLPYSQVLAWYQEALKSYPDARYRDWKDEMYIEDQGVSRWHAIKISKTGGPKTVVTFKKDNWTWVIATLVIRFIGVFVVLMVLWMGLNLAVLIMRRTTRMWARRHEATAASPPPPPAPVREAEAPPAEVDPERAAAIGCALRLYFGATPAETVSLNMPDGSAWAQNGKTKIMEERLSVFNRRSR